MARGKGRGHKGQHRRFTNPDDLAAEREREAKNRSWRRQRGQFDDDEEEEEESGSTEHSSSEDESEEDQSDRKKGVEGLIEVENPNRLVKRQPKLDQINVDSVASSSGGDTTATELSRREREEIEKQRAKENYLKLHAQGKTDQARADLARLAIIRQQREDAAKKREEERKMREQQEKEKQASKTQGIKAKK